MSVLTQSRRYDVKSYTDSERQELIGHFISKTQPQRRMFLGKTEGFIDKKEQVYYRKMLKAYLKGAQFFYPGEKMEIPVTKKVFDKEKGKHVEVETDLKREVLRPVLVKQMYFFN